MTKSYPKVPNHLSFIPPSFFLSCNLDGGREGPRVRDRKNGKEKVNIDEEIRKAEEIKGVLSPPDNPPSIFVIFIMCKMFSMSLHYL